MGLTEEVFNRFQKQRRMTPEQKSRIESKIKQLQKLLGPETGYFIGFYQVIEEGSHIDGRIFLNTRNPNEMAAILLAYAKQNPVFEAVVAGMEAARRAEREAHRPQAKQEQSKLILPKMGIVK